MEGFGRILRFVLRGTRRLVVFVVGVTVVVVGLILVPLPGPGWAIVFAGFAILATEFTWAEVVLTKAKRQLARFAEKAKAIRSKDAGADNVDGGVTEPDPAPQPPPPEPATRPRPPTASRPDQPARR
jgi:hypothetical protein